MFRSHQFIATCFGIIASTAIAVVASARPADSGDLVTDLQIFTHVAYIPAGLNQSSIRIEGVKAVKVATERRTVTNARYCDQPGSEPGGSMHCQRTIDQSYVSAYRVTYSYRGQPMASDEFGSTYFTFNVYFRPDEISPEIRAALLKGKIKHTAVVELFELAICRGSIRQIVIDEGLSTLCDGKYVDGNWIHANPKCEDRIAYREAPSPSPYVVVRVVPASSRIETATVRIGPWEK